MRICFLLHLYYQIPQYKKQSSMNRIIVIIIFSIFLLNFTILGHNNSNCSCAKNIVVKMWEKWGIWNENLPDTEYLKHTKITKKLWYDDVSKNHSYYSLGPKFINIGGEMIGGNIIPKSQNSLVTVPCNQNKITININKIKGRAKTDLCICVHEANGTMTSKVNFQFPISKTTLDKSWTISNVKGKIISVVLKNHSTTKKFKYKINYK